MKTSSCARLFEVEALRDGRLAGVERERFERHLANCRECTRETAALDALAEAFRAPEAVDELRVRRERNRLLDAFDRQLAPRESSRAWAVHRSIVAFAAAAALAAGAFVFWPGRAAPVTVATPPSPPEVVVSAEESTRYTKQTEGTRDRIVLEQGVLRIQVMHAVGARSVLVELPDGELEDTGTTFTVTASNGRTTRVAVEEGSVVLRLRGEKPIVLGAGQSWSALPVPAPSASLESALPVRMPPSRAPAKPDASEEFRAAMSAFDSGDSSGAEARFAQFVAKHPADSRAEDAAYLRVIALQRMGDDTQRRKAAEEYLRWFPTGFRRAEVERLSR